MHTMNAMLLISLRNCEVAVLSLFVWFLHLHFLSGSTTEKIKQSTTKFEHF